MRNLRVLLTSSLPAAVLLAGLTVGGPNLLAQQTDTSAQSQQQQQQPDQSSADTAREKAFSGKIMKSAGKLVLYDADNKVTYQLNDQQKAEEFVNKNVKITGVLDASTGTIRVTSIEPVA